MKKQTFQTLFLDCRGKGERSNEQRYCCIYGVQSLGIKSTCKGTADMEVHVMKRGQVLGETHNSSPPTIEMRVPTSVLFSVTGLFVSPLRPIFLLFLIRGFHGQPLVPIQSPFSCPSLLPAVVFFDWTCQHLPVCLLNSWFSGV